MNEQPLLILYDGHCLLCNRFIRSILSHDSSDRLRAAALQTYAQLKNKLPIDETVDSVVLVSQDKVFYKSEAVLRLKAALSSIPFMYSIVRIIPVFIRDAVYDVIAKNRLKWFGSADECVIPTAEERSKYLLSEEEIEAYLGILVE